MLLLLDARQQAFDLGQLLNHPVKLTLESRNPGFSMRDFKSVGGLHRRSLGLGLCLGL